MEDKEIYSANEDWDLSPDTRVTLHRDTESIFGDRGKTPNEEQKQKSEAEKQKKRNRLLKKGMALFTSAVVVLGVVSLNGTDSSGKGDSGESSYHYDCPICHTADCEFWDHYYQNSVYSVSAARDSARHVTMDQHFGLETLGYLERHTINGDAIRMSDGRRALLYSNFAHPVIQHPDAAFYPQTGLAVTDSIYVFTSNDESKDGYGSEHAGIVQLIYSPDGMLPEEYADLHWESIRGEGTDPLKYCVTVPVPGETELWLRGYSTYSEEDARKVLDESSVKIWQQEDTFALGNRLAFTESERVKLFGSSKGIVVGWGKLGTSHCTWWDVQGLSYPFLFSANSEKGYVYQPGSLYVQEKSFEDICDFMLEREKAALERGHEITARIRNIGSFTFGNMGYTVYLVGFGVSNGPDETEWSLFFVPDAEKNIAAKIILQSDQVFASDEDLDRIDEIRSLSDLNCWKTKGCSSIDDFLNKDLFYNGFRIYDILSCIGER